MLPTGLATPHLVVSDLDGTLLRTDGTASGRTAAAIAALHGVGIEWMIATARPPRWLNGLTSVLGPGGVAVCSNGAFVYDAERQLILDERPIVADTLRDIVADLRATYPDIGFAAEGRHGLLKEPHYDDVHRESSVGSIADVLDLPTPPGKLLARSVSTDPARFIERVTDLVGDRGVVAYSGATGLAEISAAGVTKALVLDKLCSERGIDPAHVWAFGDMPNDLAMLAWAGTSFAVANGHPAVLKAANHVVPGNDGDGVAQTLESLVASLSHSDG